jgi:cytochrome P450
VPAVGPDDHLRALLINGRTDTGKNLSDKRTRDLVVSLIADGYETASGAMAWAVHALLIVHGAWDRRPRRCATCSATGHSVQRWAAPLHRATPATTEMTVMPARLVARATRRPAPGPDGRHLRTPARGIAVARS